MPARRKAAASKTEDEKPREDLLAKGFALGIQWVRGTMDRLFEGKGTWAQLQVLLPMMEQAAANPREYLRSEPEAEPVADNARVEGRNLQ